MRAYNSLLIVLALSAGCASKGAFEQAESASERLGDSRAELLASKVSIDKTVTAFDDLVKNPSPDLKPQFATFTAAVNDLNARADRAGENARSGRKSRDKYLAQWKSDTELLTNPELKARAIERMGETRQSFDVMASSRETARSASQPFITHVNELQRYIGGDLTSAGIKSVADQAERVRADGEALKTKLDAVIAEIDRVNSEIKPAAPVR